MQKADVTIITVHHISALFEENRSLREESVAVPGNNLSSIMLKHKLCFFLFLPCCLFDWVILSSVISIHFTLSDHTTLQKRHIITSNEEVVFFGLFLLAFQFVHSITGKLATLWHVLQCLHDKTRSISHAEHQKWVQNSRPIKGITKAWVYAEVLHRPQEGRK